MNKQAFELGLCMGYASTVMPTNEAFEKSAVATGLKAADVKRAYVEKIAAPWLPMLAGAAGLGLGAYAIPRMYRWAMGGDPQAPNIEQEQRMDPFHQQLRRQTMYNQGLSRDLQAARGAFAPAANPFGGS